MIRRKARKTGDAELDITAFMNLMIVLVPVLLLNMVFTHIRVLNLQLPELQDRLDNTKNNDIKQLELVIRKDKINLNYPAGQRLRSFPKNNSDDSYPYTDLQDYLKQIKSTFQRRAIEKKDIIILPEPNIPYQVVIQLMDTVRSYEAVVATSVVDAELFPDVSFGDAP